MTLLAASFDRSIDEVAVNGLLRKSGRNTGRVSISLCAWGGNNRIYKVGLPEERLALKHYVRRSSEGRDRMLAEWDFLRFAEAAGLQCTPKALEIDTENNLALYDFVDGKKCHPTDVDSRSIREIAEFVRLLNSPRSQELGASLPRASETAFSITGHLAVTHGCLARLKAASNGNDTALSAMVGRLTDLAARAETMLRSESDRLGIDTEADLPGSERVISPSDLGFHNLLKRRNGDFAFIDFEYAGWDDPAKLVADFFFQPAIPVSPTHAGAFIGHALPRFCEEGGRRLSLLTPLFGLRWCFILLNPFHSSWVERHPDELRGAALTNIRRERLALARRLIERVEGLLVQASRDPILDAGPN